MRMSGIAFVLPGSLLQLLRHLQIMEALMQKNINQEIIFEFGPIEEPFDL